MRRCDRQPADAAYVPQYRQSIRGVRPQTSPVVRNFERREARRDLGGGTLKTLPCGDRHIFIKAGVLRCRAHEHTTVRTRYHIAAMTIYNVVEEAFCGAIG